MKGNSPAQRYHLIAKQCEGSSGRVWHLVWWMHSWLQSAQQQKYAMSVNESWQSYAAAKTAKTKTIVQTVTWCDTSHVFTIGRASLGVSIFPSPQTHVSHELAKNMSKQNMVYDRTPYFMFTLFGLWKSLYVRVLNRVFWLSRLHFAFGGTAVLLPRKHWDVGW